MKKDRIKYSLIILLVISTLAFTIIGCSKSDIAIEPNDANKEKYTVILNKEDLILSLEGYGAKGALVDNDMSIVDMLIYAAQDEYLARAEYDAIIENFDVLRPYSNILKSEESHLNSLEGIFETYNMQFPGDESKEQLIIPADLLEAAKIGVQAEIDNIAMYEEFLTYDLPDDIEEVFNSLLKGSLNHLEAFQNQVAKLS